MKTGERLAVLESKLDSIIAILHEEKADSKEVHRDLERQQEEHNKKISSLEKVQYGLGLSLVGVTAVGLAFIKKITGIDI